MDVTQFDELALIIVDCTNFVWNSSEFLKVWFTFQRSQPSYKVDYVSVIRKLTSNFNQCIANLPHLSFHSPKLNPKLSTPLPVFVASKLVEVGKS